MDVSRLRQEDERDAQEGEDPVDVPYLPPDVLGHNGGRDDGVGHEEAGEAADVARLVQLPDGLGRPLAPELGHARALLGQHDGPLPLAVVDGYQDTPDDIGSVTLTTALTAAIGLLFFACLLHYMAN